MARYLTLLFPVTPHICSELWEMLGHTCPLAGEKWPVWSEDATVCDTVNSALQVNGKLRGTMSVPADTDKAGLEAAALKNDAVQRHAAGKTVRKVIVVPGKLVNVVTG